LSGLISAVIGIGSNVGDRAETIARALEAIGRIAIVDAVSRVRETPPVGGPPQGEFLNAAALVRFDGAPLALLDELQRIERELGRVRVERWGPRTIDLDVLWIDGLEIDGERLVVPHPRLHERPFAYEPLLEVAPHALDQLRMKPR
jgi:2-amino-4-hydroxy-6-hydroxymethyldihydropteridine diphosphokinase